MAGPASAFSAYRNGGVETLSQRDLIVRLYFGAERFLRSAAAAMEARRIEEAHNQCQNAKAVFSELLATLNLEQGGEIAVNLERLYTFLINHIALCNIRKDPAELLKILPIVATLREAWAAIPQEQANLTALPEGSHGHVVNLTT